MKAATERITLPHTELLLNCNSLFNPLNSAVEKMWIKTKSIWMCQPFIFWEALQLELKGTVGYYEYLKSLFLGRLLQCLLSISDLANHLSKHRFDKLPAPDIFMTLTMQFMLWKWTWDQIICRFGLKPIQMWGPWRHSTKIRVYWHGGEGDPIISIYKQKRNNSI